MCFQTHIKTECIVSIYLSIRKMMLFLRRKKLVRGPQFADPCSSLKQSCSENLTCKHVPLHFVVVLQALKFITNFRLWNWVLEPVVLIIQKSVNRVVFLPFCDVGGAVGLPFRDLPVTYEMYSANDSGYHGYCQWRSQEGVWGSNPQIQIHPVCNQQVEALDISLS